MTFKQGIKAILGKKIQLTFNQKLNCLFFAHNFEEIDSVDKFGNPSTSEFLHQIIK